MTDIQQPSNSSALSQLLKKIGVIATVVAIFGGLLTGIMTYTSVGYTETFFMDWITSFGLAVMVMAPCGFVMMMLVGKAVKTLLPRLSETKQNMMIGLIMAVIMESVMAGATVANNVGLSDVTLYLNAWSAAFLAALPAGVVIAVLMTTTIKPRLARYLGQA